MKLMFDDLNSFIRKRVTVKSNDLLPLAFTLTDSPRKCCSTYEGEQFWLYTNGLDNKKNA